MVQSIKCNVSGSDDNWGGRSGSNLHSALVLTELLWARRTQANPTSQGVLSYAVTVEHRCAPLVFCVTWDCVPHRSLEPLEQHRIQARVVRIKSCPPAWSVGRMWKTNALLVSSGLKKMEEPTQNHSTAAAPKKNKKARIQLFRVWFLLVLGL